MANRIGRVHKILKQNIKRTDKTTNFLTVHLETMHGLDFKTPKFHHHIICSRCRLDKENPCMRKNALRAILDELC